eukprot:CAMPEP_0194418792 /NCGR_PEP_ID=MMETSP0176-20130528/17964_1 /TAXON_ID=216777 /ORGANISM="Proboscia alata, Strain PI-D3" /LENGTH=513 /DNA_ID=CAMNT_0039225463 /DNA_START=117 /DNA_END=1655 /DNA_ORIENTATION=-
MLSPYDTTKGKVSVEKIYCVQKCKSLDFTGERKTDSEMDQDASISSNSFLLEITALKTHIDEIEKSCSKKQTEIDKLNLELSACQFDVKKVMIGYIENYQEWRARVTDSKIKEREIQYLHHEFLKQKGSIISESNQDKHIIIALKENITNCETKIACLSSELDKMTHLVSEKESSNDCEKSCDQSNMKEMSAVKGMLTQNGLVVQELLVPMVKLKEVHPFSGNTRIVIINKNEAPNIFLDGKMITVDHEKKQRQCSEGFLCDSVFLKGFSLLNNQASIDMLLAMLTRYFNGKVIDRHISHNRTTDQRVVAKKIKSNIQPEQANRCAHITIEEVLDKISKIFVNHPDLLRGFVNFVPDSIQEHANVQLSLNMPVLAPRLSLNATAQSTTDQPFTNNQGVRLVEKRGKGESLELKTTITSKKSNSVCQQAPVLLSHNRASKRALELGNNSLETTVDSGSKISKDKTSMQSTKKLRQHEFEEVNAIKPCCDKSFDEMKSSIKREYLGLKYGNTNAW